jgi:hypothetical protein
MSAPSSCGICEKIIDGPEATAHVACVRTAAEHLAAARALIKDSRAHYHISVALGMLDLLVLNSEPTTEGA